MPYLLLPITTQCYCLSITSPITEPATLIDCSVNLLKTLSYTMSEYCNYQQFSFTLSILSNPTLQLITQPTYTSAIHNWQSYVEQMLPKIYWETYNKYSLSYTVDIWWRWHDYFTIYWALHIFNIWNSQYIHLFDFLFLMWKVFSLVSYSHYSYTEFMQLRKTFSAIIKDVKNKT